MSKRSPLYTFHSPCFTPSQLIPPSSSSSPSPSSFPRTFYFFLLALNAPLPIFKSLVKTRLVLLRCHLLSTIPLPPRSPLSLPRSFLSPFPSFNVNLCFFSALYLPFTSLLVHHHFPTIFCLPFPPCPP
jgi:hypothetical protein